MLAARRYPEREIWLVRFGEEWEAALLRERQAGFVEIERPWKRAK